jgi:hypothetical protein
VHEYGHALGFEHDEHDGHAMAETLAAGARITPIPAGWAWGGGAQPGRANAAPVPIEWDALERRETTAGAGAQNGNAWQTTDWKRRFVNELGVPPLSESPNAKMKLLVSGLNQLNRR